MSAMGPVLHLAGGIALGVDVRNLLQLERALERDGVVGAAPEEKEVAHVLVLAGQCLQVAALFERLAHLVRDVHQLAHQLGGRHASQSAVASPK